MNWTIHRDTVAAWKDMLEACRRAEHSIDLEQFIFVPDDIGKQFLDVFREKAKQGVRVRLLWDAAGSFHFRGSALADELKQDGIELHFFKTLIPRSFWNHRLWFFRNHRRSLVIDSRIAYTGSASIWEETHDWVETHMRIEGPVVDAIEQAFEAMWNRSKKRVYRWRRKAPEVYGDFAYVTNSPVRKMRYLYKVVHDALADAKKEISITTPYFAPDRRLLTLIKRACRRGVVVTLLMPRVGDHRFVDIGGQSFFDQLLRAGVHIYLYDPGMIHSKSIIVDNWATMGTLNFDNVSLRYNFEANLVSTDFEFVQELKKQFSEDKTKSTLLTMEEWKKRPLLKKALEWLILPIRPLL